MYTRFSGEDGQSPVRWLRTLKYQLPSTFTVEQWLECVDGLLDGTAARWADEQPAVKRILSEEALEYADNHDVDIFKALLLGRFTPGEEDLERVNDLVEILRQDAAESLSDYYLRAERLLHALGVTDQAESAMLNVYERSTLRKVIRHYIDGLYKSYQKPDSAPQGDSLSQTFFKIDQKNASWVKGVHRSMLR